MTELYYMNLQRLYHKLQVKVRRGPYLYLSLQFQEYILKFSDIGFYSVNFVVFFGGLMILGAKLSLIFWANTSRAGIFMANISINTISRWKNHIIVTKFLLKSI